MWELGVGWGFLHIAHDLGYYEEPLKMLAGDVQKPAINLRAPAVLDRQLTAYCIDRWIESTPSARIPDRMDESFLLPIL